MKPTYARTLSPSLPGLISPILWLGVFGLALVCTLALLARLDPFCELFVHFAAQYLIAGILLAALALAVRRYVAFVLALGLGLGNLAALSPFVFADPPKIAANGPLLRLVTANLNHLHADGTALKDFLETTDADLLVLTELAGHLEPAFAAAAGKFPHRLLTPGVGRHRPFAVLVLSRRPLHEPRVHFPLGSDFPVLQARHCLDDRQLHCHALIALHAPRPGVEFGDRRDRLIGFAATLAADVGRSRGQAMIVGDLNATAWAPIFEQFTSLGLRDAGLGQGWQPTWPAPLGLAGIPIDHIVISPRIGVEAYRRLPAMGSDHRPLAATLRLPANP